jgi:hypothetical protein
MTHTLLLTCALVIALMTTCIAAQGSGNIITESRQVRDFNRVLLASVGRVIITQGPIESLTIEAEDNVMPYVEVEVKHDTLVLDFDPDTYASDIRPTRDITFRVTMREVAGLALSGVGSIEAAALRSGRLEIDLSGAGRIRVGSCSANCVAVAIRGAGNVTLAGKVREQIVDVTGTGNYVAPDLDSRTAAVAVTGCGCATLRTHDSLMATVSGTGEIAYYGDPAVAQVVSGAGKVTHLGG